MLCRFRCVVHYWATIGNGIRIFFFSISSFSQLCVRSHTCVYITQFYEKSPNCKIKKPQLPFFLFFIKWWKRASIVPFVSNLSFFFLLDDHLEIPWAVLKIHHETCSQICFPSSLSQNLTGCKCITHGDGPGTAMPGKCSSPGCQQAFLTFLAVVCACSMIGAIAQTPSVIILIR